MREEVKEDLMFAPEFRQYLHYAHLLCGDEDKAKKFLNECSILASLKNNISSRETEIEVLTRMRDSYYQKNKSKQRSRKSSQLELFSEEDWRGRRKEKDLSAHMVPRARIYLATLTLQEREVLTKNSYSHNKDALNECLIRFVKEISEEGENKFCQLEDKNKWEILRRVVDFILENCSDEEALIIEKNCLENPDWQSIKIFTGISWEFLQKAARQWQAVDEKYLSSIRHEKVSFEVSNQLNEDLESISPITEQVRSLNRWDFWKIYLVVGIFTSLIGYLGWREKILDDKKSVDFMNEVVLEVDQAAEDDTSSEDYPRKLERLIQGNFEKLIDQRTRGQIKEVNQTLGVLPNFIDQESSLVELVSDNENAQEDKKNQSELFDLSMIKEAKESFLFLPDRESLGKISIQKAGRENIIFHRSDWKKPGHSFALNAGEYEIRSVLKNMETIILLGNVKRQEKEIVEVKTDIQNLFQMLVTEAWKLNSNQQRILLRIR